MKATRFIRLHEAGSGAPLYREVRRRILDALAQGEWPPGGQLPNESTLAQRFGVAVSTVRAGVGELTAAGVLVRRQGKGTFVARHDVERQHFRFSNVYDSEHRKVLTRRQIISMRKVRADAQSAETLELGGATSHYVYEVSAVLSVADQPVAVMELVLPAALYQGLRQRDLEAASENLYAVYQRISGVTVVRMAEAVHARTATAVLARRLGVRRGHPLLCVERVAYTYNDVPVEIRKRFYEGTGHHYLFVQNRLE